MARYLVLLAALLVGVTCEEVDPREVTYHLYTQSNPNEAIQMYVGFMNGAPYDNTKPTKLIVHSFEESWTKKYIDDIRDNYLTRGAHNVIAVDWSSSANGWYSGAQTRTKPVGEIIATFIDYLVSEGTNIAGIHCIGFGLGAHACGFAGKVLTSGVLGRITGLDPNREDFNYEDATMRLADTDAAFVDVIHTCGGDKGFMEVLGHADFYPNEGKPGQPGCGIELSNTCSHERAREYFHESILTGGFVGLECDTYDNYLEGLCDFNDEATMGENCLSTARGVFYLQTRGKSPYAMG